MIVKNGGKTTCSVTGIPGFPVKDITFSGIRMELAGGVRSANLAEEVPEHEDLYPESTMFGLLPASVLYLRHAEDIRLEDMEITFGESDERPEIVAEDVKGLSYSGILVEGKELDSVFEKIKAE